MILAAGRGERLRPLTDHLPKPMVEVAGRSILEHTVRRVKALGVERVVINAWHLADTLMAFVGDGRPWGVQIVWSREERLLDTGGGVRKALPMLGDQPVLLINGDVLWELDVTQLWERFDEQRMDGLLALVPDPPYKKSDFLLATPEGKLVRARQQTGGHTYAGIMVFRPAALSVYPLEPFSLNRFFDDAMARGTLFGLPLSGRWADMGTPQRLAQAQKEWLKGGEDG